MRYKLLVLSLLIVPTALLADPDISKRISSPEETEHRLAQIRSALESFQVLTNSLRTKKAKANCIEIDWDKIGNHQWDIQTIGFSNWVDFVELRLAKLEMDQIELKVQNAQLRRVSPIVLTALREDFEKARKKMNELIQSELEKVE